MIPKIIHQIWIGPIDPPYNLINTWKTNHPDYEFILWTADEIERRGIVFECAKQIEIMNEWCGKADIIRYEILHKYGGFYFDADSVCIHPIDEYFSKCVGFATYENEVCREGLIANGNMGFVPNHSILRDMIDYIKSGILDKDIPTNRAWQTVGPVLLTNFINTGKYPEFTVFPSHCFLPIHFTGVKYNGHKKVYAHQYWGSAFQNHSTLSSVEIPQELIQDKIEWVSVLITSYNTNIVFIRECLQSIRNQNGRFGIELVWIDDGSDKAQIELLEYELAQFRKTTRFTKVIYQHLDLNMGTPCAANIGLHLCNNDIVFKMDSDDIMLPDRLLEQLEYMKQNPNCMVCGADIQMFRSNRENPTEKYGINQTAHPNIIRWSHFIKNPSIWFINHPATCYRKSAVLSVGGYNSTDLRLKYILHDYDLYIRLLKKYGEIHNISKILVLYRIHENQLTNSLNTDSYEVQQLQYELISNL